MCQEHEETGVNNKHLNHSVYYNFAFFHTVHLRFPHNYMKTNYFLNINWQDFAMELLCFLWGRNVIFKCYVLKIGLINTLWAGDADLRLYIPTVQDGWRKSAFLTRAWFPRTTHLIMQYMEHFSEWSRWRMFIRGLEL